MREPKTTAVHGTLLIVSVACKFNSKQLLCKKLNSRINIKKVTVPKIPVMENHSDTALHNML